MKRVPPVEVILKYQKTFRYILIVNIEDSYFITKTSLQNITVTYCIGMLVDYE